MKKYTNKKKTKITIAFMGILGLCAVMGISQKEYKSTYASVEPSTQAVIYDDGSYTITFSLDELINYHFDNLYNLFNSYTSQTLAPLMENTTVAYNDSTYFVDEVYFDEGFEYVSYMNNGTSIFFGIYESTTYKFFSNDITFAYSLDWYLDNGIYSSVKSAIELDIQANQPANQGDSIMSAITSGMGLAPDVANEFLKGFTAVFWDSTNSTLTRVSNFMLVMLGIAMVMAIIKLSLSLIRSNTGA